MPDVPPFLWGDSGTFAAPKTYEVSGAGEVQPYSATATFDGTGASGAFLAALSFYSDSGNLLSRVFPGTPVQVGDVAQVSYAPFPGGLIRHLTGPGIQYDFLNVGAWLDITTTGAGPSGTGLRLDVGEGLLVLANDPGNGNVVFVTQGQFSASCEDFDVNGTGGLAIDFTGASAGNGNADVKMKGHWTQIGTDFYTLTINAGAGAGDYTLHADGTIDLKGAKAGTHFTQLTLGQDDIELKANNAAGILNVAVPGGIFLNLPGAAGASGSLWANGVIVQVAP